VNHQDTGFYFPGTGIVAEGQATLLAIDDVSLPLKKNLCYYLTRPQVRLEPVLTPSCENRDAPDYLGTHFYGTVLRDGDMYRMWYYACGLGDGPGELTQGPMCYAESEDGIQWTKPSMGQLLWRGSRDNNALALPDWPQEGVFVIKDRDDPDPGRRFKLAYNYHSEKFWTIRTATSANGIHWTAGPELPIDAFVEHSGFYQYNGMYFVNAQARGRSEGGHAIGRQGRVWLSPDFDHWIQESAESFALPEPQDPQDRGFRKPYDQVHLGTAAVSYGNALVGLYCIWHNDETFGAISGDLGLVVSNDGIHFREPVKGHVYLAKEDSPVTPVEGKSYPTILVQANGFLNVGDETRIYHGRWRNAPYHHRNHPGAEFAGDYYAEVALATLPRDRWGTLGLFPEAAEGTVWSAPVTLPKDGCQAFLNADGAGDMQVEVSDRQFALLPGYSGVDSGAVEEQSGLDCAVTWPKGNMAALGGQTVRFRIHLKKASDLSPRLYAVYLRGRTN
jgi:hypothetical protein